MDKVQCHLVRDLLELYVDGVVSPRTAQDVRRHLKECPDCRREYAQLTRKLPLPENPALQEADRRMLQRFRRGWMLRKLLIILVTAALTALVGLGVLMSVNFVGETLAGHSPISRGKIIAHEQTETDWQQVTFPEGAHLIFDKPFSQRVLVNNANNSGPITVRVLDDAGNLLAAPQTLQPGQSAQFQGLMTDTPYILELSAQPGRYWLYYQ